MAIQKSFNSDIGVEFAEAYWVISRVDTYRLLRTIIVSVSVFSSATARQSMCQELINITFTVPDSDYDDCAINGIPSIYESLKKNEIFSGGIDV